MDAADDEATPAMRHVLLHLLHPDSFERIASGAHKRSIASTYAGFLKDGEADLDEQLLTIRTRLEELLDRPRAQVDFYDPPLEGTWGAFSELKTIINIRCSPVVSRMRGGSRRAAAGCCGRRGRWRRRGDRPGCLRRGWRRA